MYEESVLCAASAYEQKYYLNPLFAKLPEAIRRELQIICVLFVEEIGGRFLMEFDEEGNLLFRTDALDSDYNYDEIGAALMVKEINANEVGPQDRLCNRVFRFSTETQELTVAADPDRKREMVR